MAKLCLTILLRDEIYKPLTGVCTCEAQILSIPCEQLHSLPHHFFFADLMRAGAGVGTSAGTTAAAAAAVRFLELDTLPPPEIPVSAGDEHSNSWVEW